MFIFNPKVKKVSLYKTIIHVQNANCEDKFLVTKIIYHRLPCITDNFEMNQFGDFIVICSVSSLEHWMHRAASTFSTTLTQTVYYSALEEVSTLHIFCHLPASITPLQACFYLQCELTELHDHTVQKSMQCTYCVLSIGYTRSIPYSSNKMLAKICNAV